MQALAIKYRPNRFDDVTEQDSVKAILQNQLKTGEVKGAYVFVGAAGTGKTTCARIFANEINHGQGNPIEMDAASNNSVDDVRAIEKMAQTRSIDSEYKTFIIDECHMFSQGAWAAMLKLIEEPPAKSIFILCTTDYWKIPKTILSRCQRFDFKRISTDGIFNRLVDIMCMEGANRTDIDEDAIDFIARVSDGCMREAITNLDKCLAYSTTLSLDDVSKVLGVFDYNIFYDMTSYLTTADSAHIIKTVESVYSSGQDMKQFVKSYMNFMLDVLKYKITETLSYTTLPSTSAMNKFLKEVEEDDVRNIFEMLIKLDADIKWSQSPRAVIEATMLAY